MRIETLDGLLKSKHGNKSVAYIKDRKVMVSFNGSKVYGYRSTIRDVAERLELIPEIDITQEARQVLDRVRQEGEAVGHWVISDTLNWLDNRSREGMFIDHQRCGDDDYGRPLAKFYYTKNVFV